MIEYVIVKLLSIKEQNGLVFNSQSRTVIKNEMTEYVIANVVQH
jgi:hypothetical protein